MKKNVNKERATSSSNKLYTYQEFLEKMEGYKEDGRYEMALEQAKTALPKLYERYMSEGRDNAFAPTVIEDIEKLFAAVREQIERVPFLSKPKCYKAFVLNIILNSGLGYEEVMLYLDSLNVYDESDKGWKKINWNTPLEEKFDILGWEKVVKRLIVLATSSSYSLAA